METTENSNLADNNSSTCKNKLCSLSKTFSDEKKDILHNSDYYDINTLLRIVKTLRGKEGCPWDKKQTFKSLKSHVTEECAELLDAVDENRIEGIREELGDMLLHIVFFSQIAKENGFFEFKDVVLNIVTKLIRRHPHVFAREIANTPDDVLVLWKKIKLKEKNHKDSDSILDSIPDNLPSLFKAEKIQRRVAEYGFDWKSREQIIEKIEEELNELKEVINTNEEEKIEDEIGDLLFSVINLVRFGKKNDTDAILKKTIDKFVKRFRYVEKRISEHGISLDSADVELMEKYWNEGKI